MKKILGTLISLITDAAGKIRKRFVTKPVSSIIISCAAVLVIIVIILLCPGSGQKEHVTGSGYLLDPGSWKENENGFRYYDKEGYVNSFGIDVSEWVEEIDFRALKRSGVEFVIFRVGYRGYETGKFVLDNNLATYLKQASSAGLKMGAYFVSQAISEEEAVEEARFVMDHVKGYPMEMPLYIDLEPVYDAARTDSLTVKERTDIILAFCNAVEENGYRGGVYANEVWFTDMMELDRICGYDIWLARYAKTLVTDVPINMWQYTDEGVVEGTPMWVDLNTRVSMTETQGETDAE